MRTAMVSSAIDPEAVAPTEQGSKLKSELDALELDLLLEGIFRHYGYDFRQYARASLRRRVASVLEAEGLQTISRLQDRILHDTACMDRFLLAVSVNVTS